MTDTSGSSRSGDSELKIFLRDINEDMVAAWSHEDAFGHVLFESRVAVRLGRWLAWLAAG